MSTRHTLPALLFLSIFTGGVIGLANDASAKTLSGAQRMTAPLRPQVIAKEIPRSFMASAMRGAAMGDGGRSGLAGAANGAGKGGRHCLPMGGGCISAP
ncbi:MAG: hypothetical protein ABL898_11530 [Hyphomicrobiaceae bacterium]